MSPTRSAPSSPPSPSLPFSLSPPCVTGSPAGASALSAPALLSIFTSRPPQSSPYAFSLRSFSGLILVSALLDHAGARAANSGIGARTAPNSFASSLIFVGSLEPISLNA
uniref:Putative secreted protein n=1 Tax=Ixodes ricinus TaxID=34613 RepID=A0A6B0UIV0_IXORI